MTAELTILGAEAREELNDEMEELVIERSLRAHPFVKAAWDSALARRRQAETWMSTTQPRLPSPPESPVGFPALPLPTPMKRLVENAAAGGDYIQSSTVPDVPRARSKLAESFVPEQPIDAEIRPRLPTNLSSSNLVPRGRSLSY